VRTNSRLPEHRLADALARLEATNMANLETRWRRAFGRPVPPGLPRTLLVRVLSYRLQAEALGDLDRDTARALDRLAGPGGGAAVIPLPDDRGSQPGTVLVREWQGTMHTVMVMSDGYAWNGVTYRSLSEVARAITGTRWNGPRFFGLRVTKGADDPGGPRNRSENTSQAKRRAA
jgi:hypothetical protein